MKMKNIYLCIFAIMFGGSIVAQEVTSDAIADIFYRLNGDPKNPKMKINHTKGFCASGVFIPNKDISKKINIPLLEQKKIKTLARFSLGGAVMDDRSKGRGLALRLEGDKETWTMVMLNSEINFARTPEEFFQFFSMKIPVDGKVDQAKIAKLTSEVESFRKFDEYMKNVGFTASVANTPYYSVHTFYFKDAKSDKMIAARWKFVPEDGVKYLSENDKKTKSKDYLLQEFNKHIKNKSINYKMYLVLANPQDVTNDTTAIWSGKHEEVLVGILNVNKYEGMDCNQEVFFPSDIPQGVGAPVDPLFQIRNETYGVTFGRRQ